MKLVPIFLSLVATSSSLAQAINPVLAWNVSADNGTTWSNSLTLTNASVSTIKVRGSLNWGNSSGLGTAFSVVSFDGFIAGALNETGGNILMPFLHQFNPNTGLVTNLNNGTVRFSAASDTGAAGSNSNWWIIVQDADIVDSNGGHSQPNIVLDNPAHFLYFDLAIDYSAIHTLNLSCILNTIPDRAARVYTQGADGGYASQTRFDHDQVVVQGATIQVNVPSPASSAVLTIAVLVGSRRRR